MDTSAASNSATSSKPNFGKWDPRLYLQYASERGRPFLDLVSRIDASNPALVVDLGCGPGTLTTTLTQRWPDARIIGVDASAEMIADAEESAVEFVVADLRDWRSPHPVDVLISNATLQWLPDRIEVIPRLLEQVGDDGWFAFQMPHNWNEPNHALMRELSSDPRFAPHVAGVARTSMDDTESLIELAAGLGFEVDAWETTYLHILQGEDPVYDWISGTGLRPTLDRLPAGEIRETFITEYKQLLRQAYPKREVGTILRFPRQFIVGHRR